MSAFVHFKTKLWILPVVTFDLLLQGDPGSVGDDGASGFSGAMVSKPVDLTLK